jgi:hypothetical protein
MKVPSTTTLSFPALSPLLAAGKNIVRYLLDIDVLLVRQRLGFPYKIFSHFILKEAQMLENPPFWPHSSSSQCALEVS